jgi:hypothetical protein
MAKPDVCAFCARSGTDFKPEHWVPQWVSRVTIGQNQGVLHHTRGRQPWFRRIVDLTVPHVCPECNHHWMSDIETRSRNLVLPLIEGQAATLPKAQQEQLATWCFMKLITLELGRPANEPATYPPPVYQGFRIFRQPPNGCVLSVGVREMNDVPPMFVWWRSQAGQQEVPEVGTLPSYRTTLTIGHLVIDVVGLVHPDVAVTTEPDERFVQVWPVCFETLEWPPTRSFKGIVNSDLI